MPSPDVPSLAVPSPLPDLETPLARSSSTLQIAIDAYIDHEPHEVMTRVKVQRIWQNVERAADSKTMTSYITTAVPEGFDWGRFDGLKAYVFEYVGRFEQQVGAKMAIWKTALRTPRAASRLPPPSAPSERVDLLPCTSELARHLERVQVATQTTENRLVLVLLQAAYGLLRFGFYSTAETTDLVALMMAVRATSRPRLSFQSL